MMLQDMTVPEDASAETTAVCGSSYFYAAAAVVDSDAVATMDVAAAAMITAVCGSSYFSAAVAVDSRSDKYCNNQEGT